MGGGKLLSQHRIFPKIQLCGDIAAVMDKGFFFYAESDGNGRERHEGGEDSAFFTAMPRRYPVKGTDHHGEQRSQSHHPDPIGETAVYISMIVQDYVPDNR